MKIVKSERVVRYQVEFTPKETRLLQSHREWRTVISVKSSQHNGHGRTPSGRATLTKRQINDVCDALGINGREFMAGHSHGHNSPDPSASDPADAQSSSCAKGDSNPHGVTH